MFLKRSSVVALCVSLVFLHGCRREVSSDVNFAYEVSPQQPQAGQTTITLYLTDRSLKSISGAHIKLEANMSHAGMTPVFEDAREVQPGTYRTIIELSMAGDWVVIAHVTLPDGRKVDHQFEIKGVVGS